MCGIETWWDESWGEERHKVCAASNTGMSKSGYTATGMGLGPGCGQVVCGKGLWTWERSATNLVLSFHVPVDHGR
jgi:hypothetical protein